MGQLRQHGRRHHNNGLRKVCGCARRTWAKCPHAWYFNYKPRGGQAYRFSLDKHTGRHVDSKSARALFSTYLVAVVNGSASPGS